jgi:GTP-binding protein
VDGAEFVAVDIPGLIEGSHQGKGLGDRFLRHVERALVLVHLVDISSAEGRDPLDDYYKINHELALFSKALREKPQIVAGNKIDLITEEEVKNQIRRFKREGIELIPISAARGDRVRKLVWLCHLKLKELKPTKKAKTKRKLYRYEEPFWVSKEGEVFVVEGKAPERLCRLCLDTKDALEYFYESLDRLGVLGELKRRGLKKGDIIRICGQEFEYS